MKVISVWCERHVHVGQRMDPHNVLHGCEQHCVLTHLVCVCLPFSLSGTKVSMGGSSSPLSSKQHFAWDRKSRRPCSSWTDVTREEEEDDEEAEASILSTSLWSRRKSWTMPPKMERLSLDSSSTSRVSRLSGAKKHTNASLMRCIPPRPRERMSGGRW